MTKNSSLKIPIRYPDTATSVIADDTLTCTMRIMMQSPTRNSIEIYSGYAIHDAPVTIAVIGKSDGSTKRRSMMPGYLRDDGLSYEGST